MDSKQTFLGQVGLHSAVWPDGQILDPYLTIYNNEILPNDIKHLPKYVQYFARY